MKQVKGVDISHWQGSVDFTKLKAQGNEFCFAKATDGSGGTDAQFLRSKAEAPKAGLIFGSYHFFHPSQDVDAQVKHYAAFAGFKKAGDLPPVIDWESTDRGTLTKGVQKARALKFLEGVEKEAGVTPMIYASPGFLEAFGDLTAFIKYPLWIAHYGVNHPRIPAPWKYHTFWQYSDQGGMDLDLFNGSLEHLHLMAGIASQPKELIESA